MRRRRLPRKTMPHRELYSCTNSCSPPKGVSARSISPELIRRRIPVSAGKTRQDKWKCEYRLGRDQRNALPAIFSTAQDRLTSPMSDSRVRHLNLAGASNFRAIGGYAARDGRAVRWQQIYRSNHLGHLTTDDIAVLRGLGLKSAFDFRGTEERAAAICRIEEIAVHSLPIEPTVVADLRARLAAGQPLSSSAALDVMRDSYRNYVRHNTPRFRALFAHLLEDRAPLVIHCTAGKDRTGFACPLILPALGVPDDLI